MMMDGELRFVKGRIDLHDWTRKALDPEVRRYAQRYIPSGEMYDEVERWFFNLPAETRSILYRDALVGVAWANWYPAQDHDVREMSIMIYDRSAWGRGLGTAAARFMVQTFPCRMWLWRCHATNVASVKIARRLGFALVGTVPGLYVVHGGTGEPVEPVDQQIYARVMRDG